MKKLLLDSCTKTAFSFDNILYEQCDGVSMRSSLGAVLANIILNEFENVMLVILLMLVLFISLILKFWTMVNQIFI